MSIKILKNLGIFVKNKLYPLNVKNPKQKCKKTFMFLALWKKKEYLLSIVYCLILEYNVLE